VRALPNLLAALFTLQAAVASGADDLWVDVDRNGASFDVRAVATVSAPISTVWQVLTDYDNLARFIPGLSRSAVQARSANRVVVEQKGEARFLVFSYPIEVRLEVIESPTDSITSRAIEGNLKRLRGRYELRSAGGGIQLRYSGELEPDFALPPIIGTLAVRTMVEEQFGAMVAEIERRAAAAR
jgi:ribosome-associated toxin RatA of RatAB toxin-antitoxin module